MSKIRKVLVTIVAMLSVVALAGCSNSNKKENASGTPKSLNVQFVPSVAADKMEGQAKPLAKMLSKRLGIPVHVTVSTDYNTVIEAMKSKRLTQASCQLTLMCKHISKVQLMFYCNQNVTA